MPAVNASKAPKSRVSGVWTAWQYLRARVGGSWSYVKKYYVRVNGSWVEIWNARPEVTSGSFTAPSSTSLSFSGSVDPNYFTSTAYYRYREVGTGTWINSGTTTTGSPVDGSRSYSVTATVSGDTWKNWEAQAMATNDGGTSDAGSTITLDCRRHDNSGSGWSGSSTSDASSCGGCGTVTTTTYTKSGCPSYSVSSPCGTWNNVTDEIGSSGTFAGYPFTYASYGYFGQTGIYWRGNSQCDPRGLTGCCGGYQIKYFQAERCSVTGAERWVDPECFSVW